MNFRESSFLLFIMGIASMANILFVFLKNIAGVYFCMGWVSALLVMVLFDRYYIKSGKEAGE